MAKVAINGFGRVGCPVLRHYLESQPEGIEIVAINAPSKTTKQVAHNIKYDSTMGRYRGTVSWEDGKVTVDGKTFLHTKAKDPSSCPWAELGVEIVLECSGQFKEAKQCQGHIDAGAKKVLISAPGKAEDITIVLGVNHEDYNPEKHNIISNASCTTNCLAPVAKVLDEEFGIVMGLMTTIHSYTSDQRLLDKTHKDLRRARSAAVSMIPTTTGAAKAVGKVLPQLAGKLNGMAVRVPTPNVSMVDLVCMTKKPVTAKAVNKALKAASEGALAGYLEYTDEELVSCDFNGDAHSGTVDASLTMTMGDNMVKVIAWYDNEMGYSARLVDLCAYVAAKMEPAAA